MHPHSLPVCGPEHYGAEPDADCRRLRVQRTGERSEAWGGHLDGLLRAGRARVAPRRVAHGQDPKKDALLRPHPPGGGARPHDHLRHAVLGAARAACSDGHRHRRCDAPCVLLPGRYLHNKGARQRVRADIGVDWRWNHGGAADRRAGWADAWLEDALCDRRPARHHHHFHLHVCDRGAGERVHGGRAARPLRRQGRVPIQGAHHRGEGCWHLSDPYQRADLLPRAPRVPPVERHYYFHERLPDAGERLVS
mmetsp:Transcript_13431/g.32821  ORF Transcript_13431/g.32821 Transcript_13431/m.32821 type:complete len:251 (+) Transcript_13431:83-835(+)